MDRLLTITEVQEKTRLAKQTIYQLSAAGKIPHVKLGSRLLFIEKDVDEWILSKRVAAKETASKAG